jgi:heat shock protein HslJ
MRVPFRSTALVAGFLALLVPAAAAAQSPMPSSVGPEASPAPSLQGVTWVLDSWTSGGTTYPAVAGSRPTLWFGDTVVNGSTGCNSIHGTYTLDGDAITFADFAAMNKMCIQTLDAQQQAVMSGLTGASTIELATGTLAFLDASGATLLTYQAQPALEGRPWVWLTPGDQPAPSESVTILFADGSATGQAPCNSYSAPYAVNGSELTLGPIVSTKMACDDLAVESAYLTALATVTGWSVDASGDLVLADASGAEVLRYTVPVTDD